MAKNQYPDECPAFEVLSTRYFGACKAGDVVEGVIITRHDSQNPLDDKQYPVLGFIEVQNGFCWGAIGPKYGQKCGPNAVLKPLTQVARDMYAAVMS